MKSIPYVRRVYRLRDEVERLRGGVESLRRNQWVPPGHFYSPLPNIEKIRHKESQIWGDVPASVPAIDLDAGNQLALLNECKRYYQEQPFSAHKQPGLRFFFENPAYSYSDAIFLYCIIRHLRPQRIIEVGCGHSSCVILDTNELFFQNKIRCTFIDPYPDALLALVKESDRKRVEIIAQEVQDVSIDTFLELSAGDILFIDSTHVSKVNSDVNYLLFQVLPALKGGVYIHFHDVFYPFEYPKEWIYEGKTWTEAYLLRAFLQYNNAFAIVLLNTYLEHFYRDWFVKEMPLCLKNPGGSIWLRKL